MTSVTRSTSRGQLVPLVFGQDAVAASQTDVQLPAAAPEEGSVTTGYEVPFDGEVAAVSWTLSAAGTAGTFTIGASINGTEDADTTDTVGTAAAGYLVVPRDKATFNASDSIGVEITTDGSWDGTTADLNVVVWVLLYLEGI